jgi:F-type H+-transporting ATPase subunit delta
MKRFVGLMLQRDRLGDVPDVLREFRVLVDEYHGVQTAEVVSAYPLDDAQRQLISSRLAAEVGTRVHLDERVDPDIIGGVIARVGDRVFDGSVRGRLERLRRTLAGSAR